MAHVHVHACTSRTKCTFWISDGNGGKEGESETIAATHGLLKGVGGEKVLQTLDMGTYFSLRVGLCKYKEREGERGREGGGE